MTARGASRTAVAVLVLALVAAACSDADPTDVATVASSTTSGTTPASTAAPTTTTVLSMGRREVPKPAAASTTVTPTTSAPASPDPTAATGGNARPAPAPATPRPAPAPPPVQPSGPVPVDQVRVVLSRIARVNSPTAAATRPGTSDLYVAERAGRIVRVAADGTISTVADLSGLVGGTDGERGMLGLTFSADGGRLYVSYTDGAGSSVLDEIRMNGDRTGSRRTLLTVGQPFSNHNGGDVHIGPDGFLWWSLGDGGSRGDPQGNGQNVDTLLGSILRIDPTAGSPYGVPADNPFVGRAGRDEVFVYGLRNPWRFSFDRSTGDLWIADVGQNRWEEVNRLAAPGRGRGANLGWNAREGTHAYNGGGVPPGHVGPIHEYSHDRGACSVTGGYVYRGARIPGLSGAYVYGDYCAAELWGLRTDGDRGSLGVSVPAGTLVSFAEDAAGELYVLSFDGWLSRIDPA